MAYLVNNPNVTVRKKIPLNEEVTTEPEPEPVAVAVANLDETTDLCAARVAELESQVQILGLDSDPHREAESALLSASRLEALRNAPLITMREEIQLNQDSFSQLDFTADSTGNDTAPINTLGKGPPAPPAPLSPSRMAYLVNNPNVTVRKKIPLNGKSR
ncbi:uncharacterized protein LOC121404427 [Drosophila obscura]|uniref:uncharacterized protein LOC121404427 n=1 Tax=Drosophila obscura TaxID=7282 RepID=UPI001BB25971|nr:uncharacterized protein LOC121404427 [Drosophila obscura]